VLAYSDATCPQKAEVFRSAGFRPVAVFERRVALDRECRQFVDGRQFIVSELRKGGFQRVCKGNPGVDDGLLGLQKRHEQEIEVAPKVARELELLAVQVGSGNRRELNAV
jgi:hypothetical protein